MTTYYMKFVNSTDDWWHFGVYQEFPYSTQLQSIIWKSKGLPGCSHNYIEWDQTDYGVALTIYTENQDRLDATQIINAELGNTYEVIRSENSITGIPKQPINTGGDSNSLMLKNNTNPARPVDMGFTLGGTVIAAQRNVPGQQTSLYKTMTNPEYYVALFVNNRRGDVVYPSNAVAPTRVEYSDGYTFATVTATEDAGNTCTMVEYGHPPWIL